MAKEKFERKKPYVDRVGYVDPDKTSLTATITTIMAKKNGGETKSYDQIDATPEERVHGITINQILFYDELYRRKNGININELLSVKEAYINVTEELPQNKSSSINNSPSTFFNNTKNESREEALYSEDLVSKV